MFVKFMYMLVLKKQMDFKILTQAKLCTFTDLKIYQEVMMIKAYFITSKHSDWIATFDNEEIYEVCWPHLEKLAKKHRMELSESSEMDDREEFFEWLENCPVDYNVDQTDDDGEDEIKVIGFVVPKEDTYKEDYDD